ncbi:hypothetical protein [Neorhizobium sp. DT-125]|uniref:hypothetical protein n=1 Tax=Neorhizobium sp. DT-125 TaxID=3396163 RepID=UPI003F1C337D
MPTVLFEADERTMNNLMAGPLVRIEESASRFRPRTAFFNKAGFDKYACLVDEHECKGLQIAIEDIAENRLQAYFAPDLGSIKNQHALTDIGITGAGAFDKDFDLDVFKAFVNVRKLITMSVSFGPGLPDLFPNLETWLNMDWRSNPIKALDGKWTKLANLSLQGFSGRLSAFDGAPIRRLFLVASSIKDIEEILRFEDLEILQIVSSRIAGDVSALSKLKKLRSVRFSGRNKLEGWEKLTSASIENFEASHYPCKFPRDGFPKLQNYVINAYRDRDPFYETGGDDIKLSAEFSALP